MEQAPAPPPEAREKLLIPHVKLENGVEMPQLAFGTAPIVIPGETFQSSANFRGFLPERNYRLITMALNTGIRHLDTALAYRSHRQIAQVIGTFFANGKLSREDIFITSKVCHPPFEGFTFDDTVLPLDDLAPNEITDVVMRDCQRSLTDLGVGYVDMMLLHWPATWNSKSELNPKRRLAAWRVLETMLERGWARAIGVSNFSENHLEGLMQDGAKVRPMVNQIESSVYLQYNNIINYCKENNIILQAYSPLGRGIKRITEDPVLKQIAEKHGKDPGQIALRYLIERGMSVVFLTSSEARLTSNQEIFSFQLDDDDMKQLDTLNREDGSWGAPSPYDMT